MNLTQTETRHATAGRTLIGLGLFDRITARITTDHDMDTALAARILDQALAYLGTCAVSTAALTPSATVDIGWHTFLLYTREYRAFCDRIAGRFIDHVPDDDSPRDNKGNDSDAAHTALAVAEAGYVIDAPLWEEGGSCSQCKDGCHNDPGPNPPTDD